MAWRQVPFTHAGPIDSSKRSGSSCETAIGPECVKTLSYRRCLGPAQLGESIAHAFATISTGNAPERL